MQFLRIPHLLATVKTIQKMNIILLCFHKVTLPFLNQLIFIMH